MPTGAPVPLRSWLTRQRRRAWLIGVLIAGVVLAIIAYRGAQPRDPLETLTRRTWPVVDIPGPLQLTIDAPAGPRTVRLLGLITDTPDACRARLRELTADKSVRLSFDDQHPTDLDAPLPAYVYLPGGAMLNEQLIREAHAVHDPDQTHELSNWFRRLTQRAAK